MLRGSIAKLTAGGVSRLVRRRQLHLQQHEAATLLSSHGLPVIPTRVVSTPDEAATIAAELLQEWPKLALRAQVILPMHEEPAARWPSGLFGVEHLAESSDASRKVAEAVLRQRATTESTLRFPLPCSKLSISPAPPLRHNHRLLLFPNRAVGTPVLRASSRETEDAIPRDLPLDVSSNEIAADPLKEWLDAIGLLDGSARKQLSDAVGQLWTFYKAHDILRLQVDIGFEAETQQLRLSRPGLYVDPFALYRQPELVKLQDLSQTSPLEQSAAAGSLFYVKKASGNIGGFGFGAGVAMSTMDALVEAGGKPANFLDGGGGATPQNVRAAIELLLADPDVEVIFINSFGGITKTDLIAKGLVEILRERKDVANNRLRKVIVRLRGTGSDIAQQVVEAATDLPQVVFIPDMWEAAQAAAKAAS